MTDFSIVVNVALKAIEDAEKVKNTAISRAKADYYHTVDIHNKTIDSLYIKFMEKAEKLAEPLAPIDRYDVKRQSDRLDVVAEGIQLTWDNDHGDFYEPPNIVVVTWAELNEGNDG